MLAWFRIGRRGALARKRAGLALASGSALSTKLRWPAGRRARNSVRRSHATLPRVPLTACFRVGRIGLLAQARARAVTRNASALWWSMHQTEVLCAAAPCNTSRSSRATFKYRALCPPRRLRRQARHPRLALRYSVKRCPGRSRRSTTRVMRKILKHFWTSSTPIGAQVSEPPMWRLTGAVCTAFMETATCVCTTRWCT